MMRNIWWGLLGLLLLILGIFQEGCTAGGTYQKNSEEYVPYITDVPPAFYNNDPTLRYWYTYPYWNPNVGED
jgi:hypothetical protein